MYIKKDWKKSDGLKKKKKERRKELSEGWGNWTIFI